MMSLIPFIMLVTLAMIVDDPEPQTITVNVTVKTEAGEPIAEAPVMVFVQALRVFGFTNAAGVVVLQPPVTDDSEEVIAVLYMGDSRLEPDVETLAEQRYLELRDQYHFREVNSVPYITGMTEVHIDVIAYESIKVTGTITSPEPTLARHTIYAAVRNGTWFKEFPPLQQQFEVRGVRKGQPAELFFILYDEDAKRSVKLSAEQTQDDIDLGEIQFPEIGTGAVVEITVQSAEDLWEPGGVFPMWGDVALISFDGEVFLSYPVNPTDGKVAKELATIVEEKEPPDIPPGVYYVTPGLAGSRTSLMLLDMVRAGSHSLLATAGVPLLTAQEGDGNELTLDAKQTRDAILAAYEVWSNQ